MATAGNGTWLVQSAHCEAVTEACNKLDWEGTTAPKIKIVQGLKTAHLVVNCPSIHKASFAVSFFALPKELPGARFESWVKDAVEAIRRMGEAFGERKSIAIVTVPKEESEATNFQIFAMQTRLHFEIGFHPTLRVSNSRSEDPEGGTLRAACHNFLLIRPPPRAARSRRPRGACWCSSRTTTRRFLILNPNPRATLSRERGPLPHTKTRLRSADAGRLGGAWEEKNAWAGGEEELGEVRPGATRRSQTRSSASSPSSRASRP